MSDCIYQHIGDDGAVLCDKHTDPAHDIVSWCDTETCQEKRLTNGAKIRSMTDEELAEFLCGMYTADDCYRCPANELCHPGHNGMQDWLRSEAGQ